jgi:hypothetical protein
MLYCGILAAEVNHVDFKNCENHMVYITVSETYMV